MIKRFSFLTVLTTHVLLNLGCIGQTDFSSVNVVQFPATFSSIGTKLKSNFPELNSQLKIFGLVDTVMILIDQTRGNQCLRFYGASSFTYLGSYGEKGVDSALYLSNPFYFNQFWKERDSFFFLIVDVKANVVLKLNLTSILKSNRTEASWRLQLPSDLIFRFNTLFLTSDSTIIGDYRASANDYVQRGRFYSYNIKTKEIKWTEYFPKTKNSKSLSGAAIPYYYYSFCSYNFEKQRLLSAMHLFKRVNVLDNNLNVVGSISFNGFDAHEPPIDYASKTIDTSATIYFTDAFAGNKYLYLLLLGKPIGDYLGNRCCMKLLVFDWNGVAKGEITLDRSLLGKFVVNERENTVYFVNYGKDKDDAPLIKYDLSKFKF